MWGHHSVSTFLTRSPVPCSRKVSPIAGLLRILSRVTELLIARVMDKLQEHRLEIVTGSVPLCWLQFVFIMILKYSCTHTIQCMYVRGQQAAGSGSGYRCAGVWCLVSGEVTPATGAHTTTLADTCYIILTTRMLSTSNISVHIQYSLLKFL